MASSRGSVPAVRKRMIVAIYAGSVLLVGVGGFAYQTLGVGGLVLLATILLGVAATLYRVRSRL